MAERVGDSLSRTGGQKASHDEQYYLQKYAPRRPKSLWSQVNVDKVAQLTAAGRMREPGLAEVRRAQEDGRWTGAYESQKTSGSRRPCACW